MSCKDCEEFQEGANSYWFRWKHTNIELRGCEEHIKEVMNALREMAKEHR